MVERVEKSIPRIKLLSQGVVRISLFTGFVVSLLREIELS